jgi:hypothetical protein
MTTPTKLFEQAVAAIRQLPPETQDDMARMLLALVGREPTSLTTDDVAAVAEAEVEIGRGERVTSEIVQAFWYAHLATR